MSFSLVPTADKIRTLNTAKLEILTEIYKNIAKLGHNPDTYELSSWSFDPSASTPEEDEDYMLKVSIASAIGRLAFISAKLAELS
jgi:hypothetical protein